MSWGFKIQRKQTIYNSTHLHSISKFMRCKSTQRSWLCSDATETSMRKQMQIKKILESIEPRRFRDRKTNLKLMIGFPNNCKFTIYINPRRRICACSKDMLIIVCAYNICVDKGWWKCECIIHSSLVGFFGKGKAAIRSSLLIYELRLRKKFENISLCALLREVARGLAFWWIFITLVWFW